MAVWLVVKKWLSSHLFKLSNRNLLVISILYISLSWGLLALAGEKALTDNFSNFIYYLMVTASTVGLMLYKVFVDVDNGHTEMVELPSLKASASYTRLRLNQQN
ncbi:hypothetical protein FORC14_1113 [Vibrio parahaemolyticus]|nr:hypothetical protein FORC14_1113 [Vibrio parahaemolyticus]